MKTTLWLFLILSFGLIAFVISPAQAQTVPTQPQVSSAPNSADFDSGMQLYRRGRYNDAVVAFRSATETDPSNAAAWYFMGYAQYVTHNTAAALDSFSRAFQADPNFDPRPYFYNRK